ncbi:20643_t:CDS:1, partial [Rhizophagus irregularis]
NQCILPIKILPGALSKLAKDWDVEIQKDHFSHYFWNGSINIEPLNRTRAGDE